MPPRVPPPKELLKFNGYRDYPIEQQVDDWGLTPEQQEAYVELFRRRLVKDGVFVAEKHDYFMLRRFLRARSYDLDKATIMITDHMAWRAEHKVDTLLQDFYFNERDKFLQAYPQGYHKLDKMGRPVYIQLIGQVNVKAVTACTSEERMFNFHVQEYERCVKVIMPLASKLAGRKVDQTFGIMDVRGVGMGHLSAEVRRMLGKFTKTDQDNYPEMLGHICIINAPAVFQWVWAAVKGMVDKRTQDKIEILGVNYIERLKHWVDEDSIPAFLGGRSAGTLLDDVGPWNDPALVASLGLDLEALKEGRNSAMQLCGSPSGMELAQSTFTQPQASLAHGAAGSMPRGSGGSGVGQGLADGRSSAGGLPPSHSLQAATGFFTPQGSIVRGAGDGHAPHGGDAVATATATAGAAAAAAAQQLASIVEGRSRTLVERVRAIEAMIPQQSERLRAEVAERPAVVRETASTRSAPEGSLLHRVEVLEEALEALLVAQEAALQQQAGLAEQNTALQARARELEAQAAAAAAAAAESKAASKCCSIM